MTPHLRQRLPTMLLREFRYLLGCAVVSAVVVSMGTPLGWFVPPYVEGPYETDPVLVAAGFVLFTFVAYAVVGLIRAITATIVLLKRRLHT